MVAHQQPDEILTYAANRGHHLTFLAEVNLTLIDDELTSVPNTSVSVGS